MEPGVLKPILASFALPPLFLLLLAFAGLVLASWKKHTGIALTAFSLVMLWLLSCHGAAVWLARVALPQVAPLTVPAMQAARVQAIVVLGGGLLPEAPEYGEPQPGAHTAARLRYGIWLARQSGLPLAFTGGLGWSANDSVPTSEEAVAARVALQEYAITLRWVESASRDTAENASLLAPLLKRDGVSRIALVTDAWHMPRAAAQFERQGFAVTPAPTGYVLPYRSGLLEWLPSASGLQASHDVLREYLAAAASGWSPGLQ